MQIEWPLSIVISQQAMTQYQLIFRHLFELKYVERQLVGVWQVLQATRGLFRSANSTGSCCQLDTACGKPLSSKLHGPLRLSHTACMQFYIASEQLMHTCLGLSTSAFAADIIKF